MNVQPVNNNINFGDLREIRCHGDFSPKVKKHARAMDLLLRSYAFKEFGKKYNYIANFRCDNYVVGGNSSVYELTLTPVDETNVDNENKDLTLLERLHKHLRENKDNSMLKIKEKEVSNLPNLPAEFCVWIETLGYQKFIKGLKSVSLHELEFNLKYALQDYEEKLAQKQTGKDTTE